MDEEKRGKDWSDGTVRYGLRGATSEDGGVTCVQAALWYESVKMDVSGGTPRHRRKVRGFTRR